MQFLGSDRSLLSLHEGQQPAWDEALHEATAEVFSMMLGCEIEAETAHDSCAEAGLSCGQNSSGSLIEVLFRRDSPANRNADPEVTAVVGMAGEIRGAFHFACGTTAARMMTARMLGIDESDAGEQQWDAIGEICNMIAGNFKSKLPGIGEHCMLSVPTIVVGSNYRLRTIAGKRRLEYRFRIGAACGRVSLEVEA